MSSSINTNIAAMTALQSLNHTNKELLTTQNRIATGYRVNDASDNAAYWSIATTMRSDRSAISTVADALGLDPGSVYTTPPADAPPAPFQADIVLILGADYNPAWAGE